MRVALVHDWLTGMRGGERVLAELCDLYPDAPVYTLFHRPGSVSQQIETREIRASILNRIPGASRHYRHLLPLFPWAVARFDLSGFDLILSVSHAAAKGIRKPHGSLHICYCLTPMRYIWDMQEDYFQYADPFRVKRAAMKALTHPMRSWDRATAVDVDYFIAASRHVQERISRYFSRESDLIYPPVDTGFFTPSTDAHDGGSGTYYLLASALVPYKRVDLAVDAFSYLGRPLVVAGAGPDLARLKRQAAGNVQFRGFVSNEDLLDLYRNCRAVIVPGREDFGLVSLEAQACGRPAIAYAAGGSLESISDADTGILFRPQTVAGLIEGVMRLENSRFDPKRLRSSAERFSRDTFRQAILESVRDKWGTGSARPLHLPSRRVIIPDTSTNSSAGNADTRHPSVTGMSGLAKRTLDVLLSLCGLVLLGLPLFLICILIRRDSPGPALFFQTRVGFRGRKFRMIKLRTMYMNAEHGSGPTWATRNDPRCTRLGGFLRRWGIDELPQLWNVLVGDMSLVGPRPERPEFQLIFEARFPRFRERVEVRGGISGLAQIRGWRGDTSLENRLQSDLQYLEQWSFWKDLMIISNTPFTLLRPSRDLTGLHPRSELVGGCRIQQGPTA